LPRVYDDPRKELPYTGVFRLKDGSLTLLTTDLKGPNGIAFSPDERYLYVANWDEQRKIVMRYEVTSDGTVENGRVFFDMTSAPGDEALDGVKVDRAGNLFVSGPGGVWVLSPDGLHLGTITGPELAANMAWGDDDGRTLYLTARSGVYRLRVLTGAAQPRTAVTMP
jgi:gluconolactonase